VVQSPAAFRHWSQRPAGSKTSWLTDEQQAALFVQSPSVEARRALDPDSLQEESNLPDRQPISDYGRSKLQAESLVLQADDSSTSRSTGMRTVALRPHVVYGLGDPFLTDPMLADWPPSRCSMAELPPPRIGRPSTGADNDRWISVCYVRTLADWLCLTERGLAGAQRDQLAGRAWFVGDLPDGLVRLADLHQALGDARRAVHAQRRARWPEAEAAACPASLFDWFWLQLANLAVLLVQRTSSVWPDYLPVWLAWVFAVFSEWLERYWPGWTGASRFFQLNRTSLRYSLATVPCSSAAAAALVGFQSRFAQDAAAL
jgi:hypothetical protein